MRGGKLRACRDARWRRNTTSAAVSCARTSSAALYCPSFLSSFFSLLASSSFLAVIWAIAACNAAGVG
jgi:hypothetical protein